jgi:hypothetical protein
MRNGISHEWRVLQIDELRKKTAPEAIIKLLGREIRISQTGETKYDYTVLIRKVL